MSSRIYDQNVIEALVIEKILEAHETETPEIEETLESSEVTKIDQIVTITDIAPRKTSLTLKLNQISSKSSI